MAGAGGGAAQADALWNLTDLVWASHVTEGKTVGESLAPGGEGEIALRVALRSARVVGQPRRYSDGVTEVDIEVETSYVVQAVSDVCAGGDRAKVWLADLKAQGQEGYLRVCGSARLGAGADPDVAMAAAAAPADGLTALFPLGWEDVAAAGRVEAAREARVRAYEAMRERIRGVGLGSGQTVGLGLEGSAAAQVRLDVFVRSLPVSGPPRMMPDRIAEVTVGVSVRDLIKMLKEVRGLVAREWVGWRDEEIDQISVRLKTDALTAVGRGMPSAAFVRPRQGPAGGGWLPDWAAQVLEGTGTAALSDEVTDKDKAHLLAARSAKARAVGELELRLNAVKLDDGRTVRERGAKDEVFRQDVTAFVGSARTSASRRTEDGWWEVTLRLPLGRLYEFSRRGSEGASP